MYIRAIILLLSFPVCASAQTVSLPISQIAGDLGVSGTITVDRIEPLGERCAIDVTVLAPNLFSELDRIGSSKGNLGSSRNRLFWVGPTRLREVENANTVLLTSRARYESWTYVELGFDTLKTKNFQDTKNLDLSLTIRWNNTSNTLNLNYEVQNIRNFPNPLEDMLRSLGVDFSGSSKLEIPPSSVTDRLEPTLVEGPTITATPDNQGLQIGATLTASLPKTFFVDSCVALSSTLQSQPDRLSDLAFGIIDGL